MLGVLEVLGVLGVLEVRLVLIGTATRTPEAERDRASAEGRDRRRDKASGGGAPRAGGKGVGPRRE